MRIVYKPLFRVHLRHGYYASGRSVEDFRVEPAPSTLRALSRHGLVFRRQVDGWTVYAEVEPDSDPRILLRPLGGDNLRLAFLLLPANPYLSSISKLPQHRPGRSVFCFDNLGDDQAGGLLHLGDAVAGQRVGEAIHLASGETYTYPFRAPVHAAALTLRDRFGGIVFETAFTLPDPMARTREFRLDLQAVPKLGPGRYVLSDNHGGVEALYYDPEIFNRRPLAVVEIFSRTDALDPNGVDRVPADYRFLVGDRLTGDKGYALQLESRSTIWRYNVVKKYAASGFQLADLVITGPVTFDRTVDAEQAIFTSTAAVELSESRRDLALARVDGDTQRRLRNLPNPAAGTMLQAGDAPGSLVSEMYVTV